MKRTDLIALAEAFEEMARGTRCLVKYPGDAPDRTAKELDAGALLMRQIAQAQPVGTVAQNSFDQHHTVLDERGNVKSWTRKGPHATPLLFCELEVGTSLYTLPLED